MYFWGKYPAFTHRLGQIQQGLKPYGFKPFYFCVNCAYKKDPASRQGLFRFITVLASLVQVAGQQLLQQLVAVKAADEAAGVVVVGDVRRILGEDVADELVDRVIAFDNKGMIHGSEDLLHLCFVVDRVKPPGCVFHVKSSLIQVLASIIPKNARL